MRWKLVVAALAAASLAAIITAAQPTWSIHLSTDTTYVGVPIWFYVNHYDPYSGRVYNLTCNLTLANAYGPIWTQRLEGAPINYTFTVTDPDVYTLYFSCRASNNETVTGELALSVQYPTPSVEMIPRWGRPLEITLKTPYPYDGVEAIIYYRGDEYSLTLTNGTASALLPPITKPETLIVELFGANTTFNITPEVPQFAFNAIVDGDRVLFTIDLVDDVGALPPTAINVSIIGPCHLDSTIIYTGTTYDVPINRDPFEAASCIFIVEKTFWVGTTKTSTFTVTVPPVYVLNAEIEVEELDPWHYIITGILHLSEPVNATVTLAVDGEVVTAESGVAQAFTLWAEVELEPGTHRVSLNVGNTTVATTTIKVPRYPYPFTPPPPVVYAGEELYSLPYYYTYREGDTIYIVAYYPGDEYYAPTTRVFTVKIIEPMIVGDEEKIVILNASEGAIVTLYCLDDNDTLIYETILDEHETTLDIKRFECPAVKVVYKKGDYVKTVIINTIEGYSITTTTCMAGSPCVPVTTAEHLLYATINGEPYTPGSPIRLPPGIYTLTLYFTDGLTASITLRVEPVTVLVIVEDYPAGWMIKTIPNVPITVALADGRTVTIGGEGVVWTEPISFYSAYFDIIIVRKY